MSPFQWEYKPLLERKVQLVSADFGWVDPEKKWFSHVHLARATLCGIFGGRTHTTCGCLHLLSARNNQKVDAKTKKQCCCILKRAAKRVRNSGVSLETRGFACSFSRARDRERERE